MDETTPLPVDPPLPVRLRIDLAGPVAEALYARAVREERPMPVEAARLVRQGLEAAGDLAPDREPVG